MIIDNISLLNVRKINQSHISFIENTNIIVGKNGEGKTTILEAIYFLLTTKSFRKKANQNIIKKQQKQLQIQATTTKETKTKIKLIYNGKTKNYAENNTPTSKTSKILKKNNVVAVSPEEINPIEAYRSERVGYFDKILLFGRNEIILQNRIFDTFSTYNIVKGVWTIYSNQEVSKYECKKDKAPLW